jgi:hypothetical protein
MSDQSNRSRILDLVESIQRNAREVRTLIEIEESNYDQSREWPSEKNFVGDDCWLWLCGDEDFGSPVRSINELFAAMESAGPKASDNE